MITDMPLIIIPRYLEAALEMGVALPQDYHAELLLIYLKVCQGS